MTIIKEDELIKDVEIDKYKLDEESTKAAVIHNKWASRLRQAIVLNDKYSERFRLLKANLFKQARMGAFDFDGNLTDVAVKNWIESHPKFKKALKNRNKYQSLVKMLEGVMYTLSQKSNSLERLNKLFLNSYYAEVNVSTKEKEAIEELTLKKQREEFKKTMKKDRRKKRGKK